MSSDNISTKYKDDNDRLSKERNSSRTELHWVLREKKESYQNRNIEQVLTREELQIKEREKSELVALFKDKEDKDFQKIKQYEKEIETLKSRCREDNDKMRQSEHEIETLKSRWKDDNEKIQRLEHEIETLKLSVRDDNNQMRQMEREIETLKSRLTGEKANQYSAYEVLQNRNDLETCKRQKKALEDERNEVQKENIEMENELQSLNSKLEQFGDSARNMPNLKKQINDLKEGYRNAISNFHEAERKIQELNETIEVQNQENRDVIEKLEKLDEEKKDLVNKLRFSGAHYKEELERKKKDLDILQRRLLRDEEKVMFSKEETSKLQKDNAELKHNLQNVSKQLKESENRFQELVDSKETSEVLQKRILNLQQEKSELNQRLTGEKANQYSAYEVLQIKNDLETCKHQKKALADECNELQKENIDLENELQTLNSKLEQFGDSARNISNLRKQIKDHEEGYRNAISKMHEAERQMREQNETIEHQKQENRELRLALNNEEQASLDKECEELKIILQDKQKELNNLESRLEIDNKEKSYIRKENKELKNILQEKLSEVRRLETRLQQCAEKLEDIPALKRHMDKLQSNNGELNLKCKHLKTVEKDVQKLKKEKQQLETEIISQRQNNETLNTGLAILNVEKLEIEDRLRSNESEIELLQNSLKAEQNEHGSAMKRLHARCKKMQTDLEKCKDANLNLLVKLDHVHNYSKISSEESAGALLDKRFIEQKLDDEGAKEEDLAKETTQILRKFASVKDRQASIKSLKKRIGKELFPSPTENEFPSDEDSDMGNKATVRPAHYSDNKHDNGSENVSACSGNQMVFSSSRNLNSTRHIISKKHKTINISANTVQISDNASINMSSNTSVDEHRHQYELEESENQQHQEIED